MKTLIASLLSIASLSFVACGTEDTPSPQALAYSAEVQGDWTYTASPECGLSVSFKEDLTYEMKWACFEITSSTSANARTDIETGTVSFGTQVGELVLTPSKSSCLDKSPVPAKFRRSGGLLTLETEGRVLQVRQVPGLVSPRANVTVVTGCYETTGWVPREVM